MKNWPFAALAALCACEHSAAEKAAPPPAVAAAKPTPEDAKAFVAKVNTEMKVLLVQGSTADWIKSTYITDDTERNSAAINERLLAYGSDTAKAATMFKGVAVDPETERALYLLRVGSPVIEDAKHRLEM